ncbi:hypothetical protein ABH930_000286 [Kitasatospora sp. GAS204A]|uniref:hypothetical protein n=1 Tax=unclassified Kitasatospora TaxID=2633591 RepID=UPI002474A810|nr:hypothetical protein [Kitasatospora sp. GAS204B]MDH6116867.1 hypothetical protein [Kitasatospora sp. GAS204B]
MDIRIDRAANRIVFTTDRGVIVNMPAEITSDDATATELTVPALESITFADVMTYVGSSE